MSTIPSIALSPEIRKGLETAIGAHVGNEIYKAAAPIIKKQAEHVDRYLNSFPIEKKVVEGKKEVLLSTPEAILIWGGVGAVTLISAPAVGLAAVVTGTAMKVRRMYVHNECSIQ